MTTDTPVLPETTMQSSTLAAVSVTARGATKRDHEPRSARVRDGAGFAEHCDVFQAQESRRWLHAALHDLPRESPILALGCGEPCVAARLSEYSSDVTVLDADADRLGELARRFRDVAFLPHHPANPLPFAHDTFDVVCSSEFLNRVVDPRATLSEMRRVLRPGGRLLLAVPHHGAVRNLLIALFNWKAHFAPNNPGTRFFTRVSLLKIVAEAGFGAAQTSTAGGVRQIAGRLVPRTLLLEARKTPAGQTAVAAAKATPAGKPAIAATENLAFANLTRDGA